MIDYYPKFITIQTLKNPKSSNVINEFKNIFSQFETLKELVTNNGPKLFHFEHWTIRSDFHQSNSLVESATQTVKHTLK